MHEQRTSGRRRVADAMAAAAVVVAVWAPIAVVVDAPLALAAALGSIAISTGAGRLDDDNDRAPVAFLLSVGLGAAALVLHWTLP